jgi:lysozyme family protein
MGRYDEVFNRVIGEEGVFSADPRDKGNWTGGAVGVGELVGTKYGITWPFLQDAIRAGRVEPGAGIRDLTLDQAKAAYGALVWDKLGCGYLSPPLDDFVFDFAVNSGVSAAARALQRAVGALPDGVVGQQTIVKLRLHPVRDVLRSVFVERAMVFSHSPQLDAYGHGWFARLFDKTWLAACEAGKEA